MEYSNIYFLGIGGIGMSAIARFFIHEGKNVAGYDRTCTALTKKLIEEGADIHFDDNVSLIPETFRNPADTLVVYTPAIPKEHSEYQWFIEKGFKIEKRSEMLGHLSAGKYVMAVAGTHGKTTVTTMTAWFNHVAGLPCEPRNANCGKEADGNTGSAFLGGISRNFNNNLVLGNGKRLAVEADEYDRSFLRLHPDAAVVTSVDPDHLDIYGTYEEVKRAFSQFAGQIKKGGTLVIKKGVEIELPEGVDIYRYSFDEECDFYADNVRLIDGGGGHYRFDIVCPDQVIKDCTLGLPGWINIENAVASVSLLWTAGFDDEKIKDALASFEGVKRRFEFYINTPELVYMDDYAHHPRELAAAITSVKKMLPERKMTAVFQPHLFTRTRDLYEEFAEALSHADEVVLLPIYPARELPIEGVDSEMIGNLLTVPWSIVPKEKIADELAGRNNDIVVTFGAGDVDAYCPVIAEKLMSKISE